MKANPTLKELKARTKTASFLTVALLNFLIPALQADTFGSVSLDFVDVGNAGNGDEGGSGPRSAGRGGVNYDYRISKYEITYQNVVDSGVSCLYPSPFTGNQPAANVSWYDAAAFVNWMNTSTGHHEAYDLSISTDGYDTRSMNLWGASSQASTGADSGTNAFRHKDAQYFLPSEDEWFKAAFHKNDGVTADYWQYATGSDVADLSEARRLTIQPASAILYL